MALGNNDIDRHVVCVGVDVVVDKLEVISHSDFHRMGVGQQTVVIPFASSHAVAVPVISHGGNDYEFYIGYVGDIVAVGLLDLESAEMEPGVLIREDVEVYAVDARQKESLAAAPFAEKSPCGQFVGEGMVHQNAVSHHECSHLFEAVEHAPGCIGFLLLGQQTLAGSDSAAYVILFHIASVGYGIFSGVDRVIAGCIVDRRRRSEPHAVV